MDNVPECIQKRILAPWKGGSGVGPGWFPLLESLDRDVSALVPEYQVRQAKEKFGGLRFYIGLPEGTSEEVRAKVAALVTAAEEESFRMCETCGKPGEQRGSGWIVTACAEHAPKPKTLST